MMCEGTNVTATGGTYNKPLSVLNCNHMPKHVVHMDWKQTFVFEFKIALTKPIMAD